MILPNIKQKQPFFADVAAVAVDPVVFAADETDVAAEIAAFVAADEADVAADVAAFVAADEADVAADVSVVALM